MEVAEMRWSLLDIKRNGGVIVPELP
jgi:hypothetical protein